MAVSYTTRFHIERLNRGLPLIAPDPYGWDNAFTLNPTIVRLKRSQTNDPVIRGLLNCRSLDDPALNEGVVAVYYRGIPQDVPGCPSMRSSVGLAVFTPELQLLKRFPYPVVVPTDDPLAYDYNGVEDQRITRIGDIFYMLYCGYNPNLPSGRKMQVCMAQSEDLIHWMKLGPVCGNVNDHPNKDAVLVPEPIDGKCVMLHRPMVGQQGDFTIALAVSDSPTGEWQDLGPIMKANPDRRYPVSWIGAGSPPLPLGGNRFLADFHTGNFRGSGDREYSAGFAILNFDRFDAARPESVVEARCDCLLEPETPFEVNSPWPQTRNLNCVFPAGSYEHQDHVVLVYGGADAYVLGARVNKEKLISHLERSSAHRDLNLSLARPAKN